MKKAVYAGSFDPVTYGHLDIIKRSLDIVDHLVIGIGNNVRKKYLFDKKKRASMLKEVLSEYVDLDRVTIKFFDKLLVDFAKDEGATLLIRGVRAFHDFGYEYQMALTNQDLSNEIETIFLIAKPKYIFISSSTVKELSHFNKDISKYVPKVVINALGDI